MMLEDGRTRTNASATFLFWGRMASTGIFSLYRNPSLRVDQNSADHLSDYLGGLAIVPSQESASRSFDMNGLDPLVAGIRSQEVLRSEADMSDWLVRAELELVSWDTFPAAMYEALLEFFKTDSFLDHESSWKLLHFIQNNYELLTGEQKGQLASFLGEAFGKLRRWMIAFVAAEILGKWYANNDAGLNMFEDLLAKARPAVVACIPHAIETIARETDNEEIRRKAVKSLEALRTHPSELVRQEATISLDKVGRK